MRKRMKGVGALIFYVLVSAVVFTVNHPGATAQAAPAATGTIAYVVGDNAGDQIWLIEPDGSHKRQIFSAGVADPSGYITSLAWRPDAGEIAFTSNYERWCSWYDYDVYAIQSDGSGYRRVTNSPACAGLSGLPQGGVVVDNAAAYGHAVYVQGAPAPSFGTGVSVSFDHVADFGNTQQPIIIFNGGERAMGGAVDVKAGQAVSVVDGIYTSFTTQIGAYNPAWRRDGSKIAYAFGCQELRGIADHPAPGDYGQAIFNTGGTVRPCMMAYGPTPSTANQLVYFSDSSQSGFYRTTENGGPGTLLITVYSGHVFQIQWLPDASGFIFTMTDHGYSSEIYHYDFASDHIDQLTDFSITHEYARDFSISPDGRTIVFERAPETLMGAFGGASDLWMIGIDGSNPHLFVAGGAHPSWSQGTLPTPASYRLNLPFVRK